jgi:hypothetical protein
MMRIMARRTKAIVVLHDFQFPYSRARHDESHPLAQVAAIAHRDTSVVMLEKTYSLRGYNRTCSDAASNQHNEMIFALGVTSHH